MEWAGSDPLRKVPQVNRAARIAFWLSVAYLGGRVLASLAGEWIAYATHGRFSW